MYTDKKFCELKKEIFDFNNLLENFIITSSPLSLSEESAAIYTNYEMNLRQLTKNLIQCEETDKKYDKCINEYRDFFYKLRSDTSININKQAKKMI